MSPFSPPRNSEPCAVFDLLSESVLRPKKSSPEPKTYSNAGHLFLRVGLSPDSFPHRACDDRRTQFFSTPELMRFQSLPLFRSDARVPAS